MTEKTTTRTIYKTYDGCEFEIKKEAIAHEMDMYIANLEKLCDIQRNCDNCNNCILRHFCDVIYEETDGEYLTFAEIVKKWKGDD